MPPRPGLDTRTVLMAAVEIADQQGVQAVTIASVAAALGVRSPSLYNHIRGLEELKALLALYALEQLYSSVREAVEGLAGKEGLDRFAHAYIRFARLHPGLYESAQLVPQGMNREEIELAKERVVDLVLQLLEPYGLPQEDALHAVRGLRSLIHGFAALEQLGGFGLPLSVEESLDFNLRVFLKGLAQ
ncbi:TetR/AcrR family transcriptional regulator [Paenibacillus woosongensis]|uniref:TetR family transcriptional regulator n=1 Tax=Paenibacillus woosongensis TaxID=307580 RepID=A0ABQ4MWV7_9BACL|nr:TetR-like C-terminal domain-containing protein [Paenibacillus woosongensis]GIP60365.1 TetR family transcriptional regulator [Paenibacillus woosongensis]